MWSPNERAPAASSGTGTGTSRACTPRSCGCATEEFGRGQILTESREEHLVGRGGRRMQTRSSDTRSWNSDRRLSRMEPSGKGMPRAVSHWLMRRKFARTPGP